MVAIVTNFSRQHAFFKDVGKACVESPKHRCCHVHEVTLFLFMTQTHLMTKKRLSADVCVPAGCPVCTDGRRGYVNTSACLGHCVSSFLSPKTCFHSASAHDLGSSLFNFAFWSHDLLDRFFFFEIFVRCLYWLRFVRPIFLGPICCAHFLFHRSSLCRAQNCVHCHFFKI